MDCTWYSNCYALKFCMIRLFYSQRATIKAREESKPHVTLDFQVDPVHKCWTEYVSCSRRSDDREAKMVPPCQLYTVSENMLWKQNFSISSVFQMFRSCVAVPEPHSFIAIIFIKSRDWHYNAYTSHFKMVACRKFNDQNKTLGVNYIVYRELSNLSCWCRHKLRKILIWDWYYWTAEVPFKVSVCSINLYMRLWFTPYVLACATDTLFLWNSPDYIDSWKSLGRLPRRLHMSALYQKLAGRYMIYKWYGLG